MYLCMCVHVMIHGETGAICWFCTCAGKIVFSAGYSLGQCLDGFSNCTFYEKVKVYFNKNTLCMKE